MQHLHMIKHVQKLVIDGFESLQTVNYLFGEARRNQVEDEKEAKNGKYIYIGNW